MQLQSDKSHRLEEIKTQFRAREGYYRLMNSPDYSQRMGFSTGTANSNSSTASQEKTCIKISLVTISEGDRKLQANRRLSGSYSGQQNNMHNSTSNRTHRRSRGARDMKICFNVGRELFVYNYDGVRTGPDASNPIYKRSYKTSSPTCHDFNQATATSGSICLLVGFSHGQVQLIDLNGSDEHEACKEFNIERQIDKTRVTCIKWLPNSPGLFLVAHASGQLYLYKDNLPSGPTAPTYQLYKQSEGVAVYTCKTKATRNPIYRWSIGTQASDKCDSTASSFGSSSSLHKSDNESCSLNEFAFSPCAKYLACVSQDGFLRVYCYDTIELVGRARSYYGGLSCVCWSPDGKYVVTGGEDDLITVWSFVERRVLARGIGHKSWVSVVAFDSFYTGYDLKDTDADNYDDDDEEDKEVDDRDLERDDEDDLDEDYNERPNSIQRKMGAESKSPSNKSNTLYNGAGSNVNPSSMTSYRFGSVGQDTQLCLWDLSDDLLQQPVAKSRISSMGGTNSVTNLITSSTSCHTTTSSNHGTTNETSNQSRPINCSQPSTSIATKGDLSEVFGGNLDASTSNKMTGTLSSVGFNKGSSFTKTFSLVGKRDKRYFSQRNAEKNSKNNASTLNGNSNRLVEDPTKLLGSSICPRMSDVPLIEPSVCKKISFERLTSLIFCQGGFITSCQDGYVFSWARPSRVCSSPMTHPLTISSNWITNTFPPIYRL